MNTILEVKDLCKTYIVNKHQNNVLKNIDLTIWLIKQKKILHM